MKYTKKFLKNTKNPEKPHNEDLKRSIDLLGDCDRIVIGVGAGTSTSGGLDYTSRDFFKDNFPQFYQRGFSSVIDAMRNFWFLKHENVREFWGYWAQHIDIIRYKSQSLQPYKYLYKLMKNEDYFICSTNVDNQLQKAGFKEDLIFAPQGKYELFQCSVPCSDELYYNEYMIKEMLKNRDPDSLKIQKEDIPTCPNCGNYLNLNIRKDDSFVEKEHLKNWRKYKNYLSESSDKKRVLLELGIGYDTPVIIRYPFEKLAFEHHKTKLIRVNLNHGYIPENIKSKSVFIEQDITEFLSKII